MNNLNQSGLKPKNNILKNIKKIVKHNKKLTAIVGGVLLLVIIGLIAVAVINHINDKNTALKDQNKITANTNSGIIQAEEYQGLKFDNVTLVKENNQYTLSMNVTNSGNEVWKGTQVDIVLKDKNGAVITTLLGYIGDDLKQNETRIITSSISASSDLSKATSKEIREHVKK